MGDLYGNIDVVFPRYETVCGINVVISVVVVVVDVADCAEERAVRQMMIDLVPSKDFFDSQEKVAKSSSVRNANAAPGWPNHIIGKSIQFCLHIYASAFIQPRSGGREPEGVGPSPLNSVSDSNMCPTENRHFFT